MRLAALLTLALAACFDPTYDNPTCASGECPAGLTCGPDGVCRLDGIAVDAPAIDATDATEAPDLDAPIPDAPIPDAPDVDAPIPDAPDLDAPSTVDIAFLPPANENVGTGNVVLANPLTIDTTVGATLPNLGAGTSFTTATPTGGGSDILVAHVGSLSVNSTLRVVGTRPFAIVAGGAITISGTIDASAVGTSTAGPNGSLADLGSGRGNPGGHITGPNTSGATSADSGGGGASYGSIGGQGGDAFCAVGCIVDQTVAGGTAGPLYNGPRNQLRGGSGGGSAADGSATCLGLDGGAGGGALLIYSSVSITLNASGVIEAHGGGGARGLDCAQGSTAGAGGGSGGQIELQSPTIISSGFIGAHGGGGGGGGDSANGDGDEGADGSNGATPADGGAGSPPNGGEGGDGAAGTTTAEDGQDMATDQNGGGGGGGAGLITIRYRGAQPSVTTSPPPLFVTY